MKKFFMALGIVAIIGLIIGAITDRGSKSEPTVIRTEKNGQVIYYTSSAEKGRELEEAGYTVIYRSEEELANLEDSLYQIMTSPLSSGDTDTSEQTEPPGEQPDTPGSTEPDGASNPLDISDDWTSDEAAVLRYNAAADDCMQKNFSDIYTTYERVFVPAYEKFDRVAGYNHDFHYEYIVTRKSPTLTKTFEVWVYVNGMYYDDYLKWTQDRIYSHTAFVTNGVRHEVKGGADLEWNLNGSWKYQDNERMFQLDISHTDASGKSLKVRYQLENYYGSDYSVSQPIQASIRETADDEWYVTLGDDATVRLFPFGKELDPEGIGVPIAGNGIAMEDYWLQKTE